MTRPALMTRHPFDEAMALVPLAASTEERGPEAPGHFQGAPHPAYANMVGPFGGITAAQALAAVLAHPEHFAGRRVGVVLSGGNVDLDALPALLARAA